MANLVPGHGFVGKGFDGFGQYDISAVANKAALFDSHTDSGRTWTNPSTGVTYELPKNVGAHPTPSHEGTATLFSQKSAVSEFFSAKASVEGNYLAFSGQFSASFGMIEKSVSEHQFGMYDLSTTEFEVEIIEATRANLSPQVLADPDFKDLPTTYNKDTERLFFRFFHKYGTHFVKSVSMGGRLYYSIAIGKSFNFSSAEFKANLEVEYKAVFGIKADAEANWKRLGKTWIDSREITIGAVGGDDSILNAMVKPEPPDNHNDLLTKWIASLETNPGAMNFSLAGVDTLFSGEQAEAVAQAAEAYTQMHLFLSAQGGKEESTMGTMILNGTPLSPPPFKGGGLSFAVIDRTSLEILLEGKFDVMKDFEKPPYPHHYDYTVVAENLEQFAGNDGVIIAMLFWGLGSVWGWPTGAMHDFILSLGAGSGFDQWSQHAEYPAWQNIAYALAGVPGWPHNQALENYSALPAGSAFPYPGLELQVFLEPQYLGDSFRYSPI